MIHPSDVAGGKGDPRRRPPIPSPQELERLPPDGGPFWNRLVFEQSPYLLQHAANPVDWRPWGAEAFEEARRQDKLVFLSIGYATCHWCHVMERESFEDYEVAEMLNRSFICVKVDREERPDVDHIYMSACVALNNGSGGWPLTVFLTPDRKPIFAGTYFPKNRVYGRPGILELGAAVARVWKDERLQALSSAEQIGAMLRSMAEPKSRGPLGADTLDSAAGNLRANFDSRHGGFGPGTKFPTPQNLLFLLRQWKRTNDAEALAMVERTLQAMRLGGIFDQIGYGFHRYSVTPDWLVPHFEKMLYDQAMLLMAYVEAWQATRNPLYRRAPGEIVEYVLRDLASPAGGFYSAEDADSEGVEGRFYLWKPEQVEAVLDKERAELFMRVYGIVPGGNFEDHAGHAEPDSSIPRLKAPLESLAAEMGIEAGELAGQIESARQALFAARERRVRPLRDDKILADWNGLAIAALAKAAQAFGDSRCAQAACRAADDILLHMRDKQGGLLKRSRNGQAGLPGLIDDYAFMIWGLIELYQATFEARYLADALNLASIMIARFWDDAHGGFFMTPEGEETPIVRAKDISDGAIPSGNSAAAFGLMRLARLAGDAALEARARATLDAFSGTLARDPASHALAMVALDFALSDGCEIVLAASDPGREDALAMRGILGERFLPHAVVVFRPDPLGDSPIARLAPYTENQTAIGGKATAYVCRGHVCKQPATDPNQFIGLLGDGGL
ncbi:MAG: hypothetical protein BWZ10_01659 [candidate division BRC1 bacterium ADurb.BinA364]|nr:MAG: hypothetical protein BWZ10_01659 [candidate division BRC1 bacterium ADurb.BinA364]